MRDRIALTMFAAEQLARSPQRGVSLEMTWLELGTWLASPTVSVPSAPTKAARDVAKAVAGGFTLARLRDGRRRNSHVEAVSALALDHDAGAVSRADGCRLLGRYRHVTYTTASHTPEAPRWRAIVALLEPLAPEVYKRLWPVVARKLTDRGCALDQAAKDCGRLWYAPTVQDFGAPFEFCACDGELLDATRVLAAQPPEQPRKHAPPPRPEHASAYAAGALRRAAEAVASAAPGERHGALCREAFALARLSLTEDDIARALLPPFVDVAGRGREAEGRRTICDAIAARRSARRQPHHTGRTAGRARQTPSTSSIPHRRRRTPCGG